MKNSVLTSCIALSILLFATSCDDNNNQKNVDNVTLPAPATLFIDTHFSGIAYESVTKENSVRLNGSIYNVSLTNGFEIDFNSDGVWVEVDGDNQAVPIALIPEKIKEYVTGNYPSLFITQIENEKTKFDIELSNDLDLVFTPQGDFVRIDYDGDNHNEIVVDPNTIPPSAKTFLDTHFQNITIRLVEKQNAPKLNGTVYDISLANRFEIDFDIDGIWTEIDGNNQAIPVTIIPLKIEEYITSHYPSLFITQIEKEKTKYEIELSNDLDLVFTPQGDFIKINDN